jgi:hypothetical protein
MTDRDEHSFIFSYIKCNNQHMGTVSITFGLSYHRLGLIMLHYGCLKLRCNT